MNLIGRVVSAGPHSVAQATQVSPARSYNPPAYFQMRLGRKVHLRELDLGETFGEVEILEPGESYLLQVIVDPDSDYRTATHPITLSTDVEIWLQCGHALIHSTPVSCRVERDECLQEIYEFSIEVSPEYAGDPVTIELCYLRVGQPFRPTPISRLRVQEQAVVLHTQHPARSVVLDAGAESAIRILYVEPSTPTTYHVRCYWDEEVEFESDLVKPVASPARFMRVVDQPREIIDRIRERSADNPAAFENWLKKKLKVFGSQFSLVILDESDEYDMAWEMIHIYVRPDDPLPIDDDLRGEVPIGALFPIVRWIPDLKFHGDYLSLQVIEEEVTGDVVAYLDPHDTTHIDLEKQALARYGASVLDTIQPFKQRLEAPLANTALIYMGCHGQIVVDDENERELFLGSFSTDAKFTVYSLAGLGFHGPLHSRPLIIVNACHSAYTVRREQVRHGLPVTFLRRIAREFLGTIGPVGSAFAAGFAQTLLGRAGEEGGVRLAAALREQRAASVRRIRQHPDDAGWLDYLFTFMYVYFGSPYTSLRLLPALFEGTEVEA